MTSKKKFEKNLLAKAISLIVATSATGMAIAQDSSSEDSSVEVIQVSGLRGSLQESMGIKRDASGVVDAISAEDIGKFPDTNLAESLQRITGISINRNNGEGSLVTARGFGPDYNQIMLNNRVMPGAVLPGGGTPNSRAFDFSDLASESVRAVEVYKTGKARLAPGWVGSSINIMTFKPFNAREEGFTGTFGAKALADTTNRVGDDVTPEVSTILNYVDEDRVFGVTFSASIQERDSAAVGAFVNQWNVQPFDGTIPFSPDATNGDPIVLNNAPNIGQLWARPSDLRYYVSDRERKRTNAQLTLQFAPRDDLELTLDYTYSKQDLFSASAEQSIWMADGFFSELTFDDQAVATPVVIEMERRSLPPRDLGLAVQELNQKNENKSIGFNADYQLNDDLNIEFDFHSSSAEGSPTAPYGTAVNFGLGANVANGQGADFRGEFPLMFVNFDDVTRGNLNPNNMLDSGDIGTSILDMNFSRQKTEITQAQLNAVYEFDEASINFGVESRSMKSNSQQALTRRTLGNWGIENPGELPDGILQSLDIQSLFDDYNTNGIFSQGITANVPALGAFAVEAYGNGDPDFFTANSPLGTNRTIEEDIFGVYFEVDYSGEIDSMPFNFLAGLRYESTDVTGIANINIPSQVLWEGNNDFRVVIGEEAQDFEVEADYDYFLPSLDFDIELKENLIARFSYSKTIARATYNQLSPAASVGNPSLPTLIAGGPTATGSSGNPALLPLESDNVDFSVEYYMDDSSYFSIGYYDKRVNNFIGNQQVEENLFGLRDVTAGPRAVAAAAALEAIGEPVNDTTLFNMVAAIENGIAYDSLTIEQFEAQFDLSANADDPLSTFIVSKPQNNQGAHLYGFEIAAQHFFGDSGFGVQANYTIAKGDIGFDTEADPSITQFALVGLSDTANLVLMYEKDAIQAREAYNWRDDFLYTTTQFRNEPGFTEALSQIDFNLSYEVNNNLTVFFEGINITEENTRNHGRTSVQLWRMEQLGARYALGARYKF